VSGSVGCVDCQFIASGLSLARGMKNSLPVELAAPEFSPEIVVQWE